MNIFIISGATKMKTTFNKLIRNNTDQMIQQLYQLIRQITYFNYKTDLRYLDDMQNFIIIIQKQIELITTSKRTKNYVNKDKIQITNFIQSMKDDSDKKIANEIFKNHINV